MNLKGIKQIAWRELGSYFNTPIGYVFGVAALFFNFLFFFHGLLGIIPDFWEKGSADMSSYMNLLPVSFILFVPAVCMRVWAEEKKLGTLELLYSLPMRDWELVLGKFLAAWAFVCVLIFSSLPLALSVMYIGSMDPGTTFSMYTGSILMAGAYVSLGMVISALTREQIVAFIIAFFANLIMFMGNYFIITRNLPLKAARYLGFFSHSYHFNSFARGLLDFGDIVYFISFIMLMLTLNIRILRKER